MSTIEFLSSVLCSGFDLLATLIFTVLGREDCLRSIAKFKYGCKKIKTGMTTFVLSVRELYKMFGFFVQDLIYRMHIQVDRQVLQLRLEETRKTRNTLVNRKENLYS